MEKTMGFLASSTVERVEELCFRWEVPDGWQQGRGAFGGLVLGALMRAVQQVEEDEARRPRVMTGELVGPIFPGEVEIEVTVMRRGSNLSSYDLRLFQGEEIQARATVILAEAREVDCLKAMPDVPESEAAEECEVLPVGPPFGPVFSQHYEYRVFGIMPLSGSDEGRAEGWLRLQEREESFGYPEVVGFLDAFWPVAYSTITMPRPMATISFTAEFFGDPSSLDPERPLLFRSRAIAEREGYYVEFRELWDGDELVALNQQTVAIIK